MKNIFYLLFSLVGLVIISSCGEDDDTPKVGIYTPPTILMPTSGSKYILTKEGETNLIEMVEWKEADFGFKSATTYTLEMDAEEGVFSEPLIVSTSTSDRMRISVKDLNTAVLSFIAGEETGIVNIRLKATVHNEVTPLYSEPIAIQVTTYLVEIGVEPIYIVGDVLGSKVWDNNNYEYIMFHSGDPKVSEYTYTGNLRANGFKLIKVLGSWDLQYGLKDGAFVANEGSSSDIKVPSEGYHTITIDTKALTYSIKPFDATGASTYDKIGIIGAFNEWSGDVELTKSNYDPHIWTADNIELSDGELKFRANAGWDINWGGSKTFPYGKATSGGDNLVAKAGKYFVKFNDLTGHYVFLKK